MEKGSWVDDDDVRATLKGLDMGDAGGRDSEISDYSRRAYYCSVICANKTVTRGLIEDEMGWHR